VSGGDLGMGRGSGWHFESGCNTMCAGHSDLGRPRAGGLEQWRGKMPRVIEAVFEDGVIKPLEAVKLEEHQRLRVAITPLPGAVAESRALIPASPETVKEVAESDELAPF